MVNKRFKTDLKTGATILYSISDEDDILMNEMSFVIRWMVFQVFGIRKSERNWIENSADFENEEVHKTPWTESSGDGMHGEQRAKIGRGFVTECL